MSTITDGRYSYSTRSGTDATIILVNEFPMFTAVRRQGRVATWYDVEPITGVAGVADVPVLQVADLDEALELVRSGIFYAA